MGVYQAALFNELFKLYKKKKALAAVILSFAVIIIGQLLILGVRSGYGIRGAGSIEFPILVLSVTVSTILPLFTTLVAIDCFSGEYSSNLMRVTLTRPVSRLKIFSAKLGAILIFSLVNLLLLLTFSSIAGLIFNVNSSAFGSFIQIITAYVVSLYPLLVLALSVVLLTNLFKNGTSVFFAAILGFIAFKVLAMLFPSLSSLFIPTHLDWYSLWLSNSFPVAKILRQFLIMTGYVIMLFTAGFYLFDKKEF